MKKGNKFTLQNGSILVNEDCTANISGQAMIRGIINTYDIFTIRKNRGGSYTTIASGYAYETTNLFSLISLTNNIEELKAGDIIEACVDAGTTGTMEITSGTYTYMSVQEI